MSVTNYYLSKGYTPINKEVVISGPNTIAIWTPVTGNRVILTELNIVANQKGTIVFLMYDPNIGTRVAAFSMGASGTIAPDIGCIEGTMVSGSIYAVTLGNSTEGWRINMTGFEDGAV